MNIEITPEQRDDILDTASSEFRELVDEIKAGTLTPGAVTEALFDLLTLILTAVIPGTVDDMLLGLFGPQLKALIVGAVDRAVGTSKDAVALLERAAGRRADAAAHLAKAASKEAAGKAGGLFSRSPDKHRERAAALVRLAEADEAAAAAL